MIFNLETIHLRFNGLVLLFNARLDFHLNILLVAREELLASLVAVVFKPLLLGHLDLPVQVYPLLDALTCHYKYYFRH